MKAEKMSIHRSKGDKDSWAASCHNFMTTMYSNWIPKDHSDMDILSYLRRADPAAVDAGKAMKDAVFAKLDPEDSEAADELAYHVLNLMFEENSPAKQLIHTGANDDSIPIGSGFILFEELHALFAYDKTSIIDVDTLITSLTTIKMKQNEDGSTYISRFKFIVDKLKAKKEPQNFPGKFLMQCLCKGLPKEYKDVKTNMIRREYADMDALTAAIRFEENIIDNGFSHMDLDPTSSIAHPAGDNDSHKKKLTKAAKKKAKATVEAMAASGTALDPNLANKQCHNCW